MESTVFEVCIFNSNEAGEKQFLGFLVFGIILYVEVEKVLICVNFVNSVLVEETEGYIVP